MQSGCVITELARRHGIPENTIYGWRRRYNKTKSSAVAAERAAASSSDGKFIELSVIEERQSLNLQEATLKFNNFSITMQGQIKSSILLLIVKMLEEAC